MAFLDDLQSLLTGSTPSSSDVPGGMMNFGAAPSADGISAPVTGRVLAHVNGPGSPVLNNPPQTQTSAPGSALSALMARFGPQQGGGQGPGNPLGLTTPPGGNDLAVALSALKDVNPHASKLGALAQGFAGGMAARAQAQYQNSELATRQQGATLEALKNALGIQSTLNAQDAVRNAAGIGTAGANGYPGYYRGPGSGGAGGTGSLANPQFGDPNASSGVRNNNFGNITDSTFAQSQPGYAGNDGRFARFDSPEAGLRAIDANLQSYGRQGVNTIAGIVSKWSPPNENDTPALIKNMSKRLGIGATQKLDMSDPTMRARVVDGLVRQEGPAPFSSDEVQTTLTGGTSAPPITVAPAHLGTENFWRRVDPESNPYFLRSRASLMDQKAAVPNLPPELVNSYARQAQQDRASAQAITASRRVMTLDGRELLIPGALDDETTEAAAKAGAVKHAEASEAFRNAPGVGIAGTKYLPDPNAPPSAPGGAQPLPAPGALPQAAPGGAMPPPAPSTIPAAAVGSGQPAPLPPGGGQPMRLSGAQPFPSGGQTPAIGQAPPIGSGAQPLPMARPAPAAPPQALSIDPETANISTAIPKAPVGGGYPIPADLPPGARMTELSPAGQAVKDADTEYYKALGNAPALDQTIEKYQSLAQAFKLFESGPPADKTQGAAMIAMGFGQPEIAQKILGGDPNALQWVEKEGAPLTLNALKSATTRFSQQEFKAYYGSAVPNPGKLPQANAQMIAEGLAQAQMQKTFNADWETAKGQGWSSPSAFYQSWTKANPAGSFVKAAQRQVGNFQGMATPSPDQWAKGTTYVYSPKGMSPGQQAIFQQEGVKPGGLFRFNGRSSPHAISPIDTSGGKGFSSYLQ